MESIEAIAFYNIIKGHNYFCCLCYKTVSDSAVHIEDNIFVSVQCKKIIEVVLGDLLIEVLGHELFKQISPFDAICNSCLSSAISCYKFIRKCKNNLQYLCGAIDTFSAGIKDTQTGIPKNHKAAYVSLDTEKCKCHRYYSPKIPQTRPQAYQKFKTVVKQQKSLELQKRTCAHEQVAIVNLSRLENEITGTCKMSQAETSCNLNNRQRKGQEGPRKQIMLEANKNKNITIDLSHVFGNINANNDKESTVKRTRPNIIGGYKKRKILIESPLNASINNEIIDKVDEPLHLIQNESIKEEIVIEEAEILPDLIDEIKQPKKEEYEREQCQYCGIVCNNSGELDSHLTTHETLMVMETIIQI